MAIGIQTTQSTLPPWMEDAYKDVIARAKGLSHQPYKSYEGQRTVDQSKSPLWQEYYKRTMMNQDQYQPFIEKASQFINKGATTFPEGYKDYMNPYMDNVINNMAHYGNRNFMEKILPALQSQFISLGQHGGGHHKEFASRAARDYGEGLAREQGSMWAQGYRDAGKLFNDDQSRQFLGAEGNAQLGRMTQAGGLADLASIQDAANIQSGAEQQGLNTAYEDFLRQENHPMQRIAQESNILQGAPITGQSTTSYSHPQAPQPGQVNTMGNLGAIAGQLYGSRLFGGNRKKGGSINSSKSQKKPFGIAQLRFNVSRNRGK